LEGLVAFELRLHLLPFFVIRLTRRRMWFRALDPLRIAERGVCFWPETFMKHIAKKRVEQPTPFTPGVTKAMVRQHAYEMFRDKLPEHPLTLEDWVLAEKDLVAMVEAGVTV